MSQCGREKYIFLSHWLFYTIVCKKSCQWQVFCIAMCLKEIASGRSCRYGYI